MPCKLLCMFVNRCSHYNTRNNINSWSDHNAWHNSTWSRGSANNYNNWSSCTGNNTWSTRLIMFYKHLLFYIISHEKRLGRASLSLTLWLPFYLNTNRFWFPSTPELWPFFTYRSHPCFFYSDCLQSDSYASHVVYFLACLLNQVNCTCSPACHLVVAKRLEQASQWHDMYCHDLEVMSSNPSQVKLGVRSTSVISRT